MILDPSRSKGYVNCPVEGHNLYTWIAFPEVPRKGDILIMGSLTRGQYTGTYLVSKVEWVMEQTSGIVYPHLTVRRKDA